MQYIAAIHCHDVDEIYSLMADDYCFIDTYTVEVHCLDEIKTG